MRFRTLGRSGVTVSEIGFGVWTVSAGWWGQYTDEQAAALLRRAYDLGITFFVLQDPGGIAIQEAYGTTRLPELYLIDGGGTVEAVYLGRLAEREADLRDRITKLLGRSKPR